MNFIVISIIITIPSILISYLVSIEAYNTEDHINNLTIIGSTIIIILFFLVLFNYVHKIKIEKPKKEMTEETWEGIGKSHNPIPFGWGLSFIAVLAWLFWYWLIGYPTYSFSQIGQWNEEVKKFNAEFSSKWSTATIEDLVPMGESIFLVQCSACHGVDAEGIKGLSQDLTKRISKEAVIHTIKNGSKNFKMLYPNPMPEMILKDEKEIEIVAIYVSNGLKGERPKSFEVCIACHGEDGKGIKNLAPNIKEYDDILLQAVLKYGKKSSIGKMPSFDTRFNETQSKAVAAYIRSLSL